LKLDTALIHRQCAEPNHRMNVEWNNLRASDSLVMLGTSNILYNIGYNSELQHLTQELPFSTSRNCIFRLRTVSSTDGPFSTAVKDRTV